MSFPVSSKYWVIVVSRSHARHGIEGGFVQANHGKETPLRRIRKGDWIVIYSPKESFEGNLPCRKFTALGEIKDDRVYQVVMTRDFHPFRRDVRFSSNAIEAPIEPLISDLLFIKNKKSWGYVFRFGMIEIPRTDFLLIASKMHPDLVGETPSRN